MHLVDDALSLDARLVPLWRSMAAYADSQIQHDNGLADDSPWSNSQAGAGAVSVEPSGVGDVSAAEQVLARHWSEKPHV